MSDDIEEDDMDRLLRALAVLAQVIRRAVPGGAPLIADEAAVAAQEFIATMERPSWSRVRLLLDEAAEIVEAGTRAAVDAFADAAKAAFKAADE